MPFGYFSFHFKKYVFSCVSFKLYSCFFSLLCDCRLPAFLLPPVPCCLPSSQLIYTPIRLNFTTTCLTMWCSPFCCKNSLDLLSHRCQSLKVCCSIWHVDVSSPVSCEGGLSWIRLVCPAQIARMDWDLGNLEAKSTPELVFLLKPFLKPVLLCGWAHYPAEKGKSLQQCLARCYVWK